MYDSIDSLWVSNFPMLMAIFMILSIIASSIIIFNFTRSLITVALTTEILLGFYTIIGYVPIWVSFMCGIMVISYTLIFGIPFTDSGAECEGSSWVGYGNRIKLAYASKFGGVKIPLLMKKLINI